MLTQFKERQQKTNEQIMETIETLVCVYTCDKHKTFLELLYDSAIGDYLRQLPHARILEVYADQSAVTSAHLDNKLIVKAKESYETLSLKTLQMIRYCVSQFQFCRLLKIDSTIIRTKFEGSAYEGRMPIDPAAVVCFIRDSRPERDYDGFLLHREAGLEDTMAWAAKKSGTINYERLFGGGPIPPFFSGKCYFISYRFAQFIGQHGQVIAQQHVNDLIGAEDVMIGRLYQDFSSACLGDRQ